MSSNQANREPKAPQIEHLLEQVSKAFLAKPRSEAFGTNTCVMCAGPAIHFKDALSKKEYSLSGICQTCQDSFFTED